MTTHHHTENIPPSPTQFALPTGMCSRAGHYVVAVCFQIRSVLTISATISMTLGAVPSAMAQTPNLRSHKILRPASKPLFSTANERCIVPASLFHGVNFYVLRAILKVESGLNPNAINRNGNGTVDVGMGQFNSMHFKELAKFGITPGHLKDACISTYVTAWHLKKSIAAKGNTWEGIARYHSATPYFNQRYQILLRNEMILSGAMIGEIQAVPPLYRNTVNSARQTTARNSVGDGHGSMIVSDTQ